MTAKEREHARSGPDRFDAGSVIWISAVSPLPPTDGNRQRHFHLLREAAREHRVTLVCPVDEQDRVALRNVGDLGVEIRSVPTASPSRGRLAASISGQPACLVGPEIDALVAAVEYAGSFDIAFGALSVAPAVERALADLKILDEQNVEENLYDRLWRAEMLGTRKIARLLDWRAVRRYERRWLKAPDAVTVCSRHDAERLSTVAPGQRFHVIPNGVDLSAIEFAPDGRDPEMIVFIGGMSWAPNIEAAVTLATRIMPVVWEERPDAQLCLVGKDPVHAVRDLAGPRVGVTGAVDSVQPYLRRATLTVVPLWSGGGTRLKILEAMAAGLPVVSTSIGAEGLDLDSGVEAVIADSVSDLAAGTRRVLADTGFAQSLAGAARRRVERDFGWEAIGSRLSAVFARTRGS